MGSYPSCTKSGWKPAYMLQEVAIHRNRTKILPVPDGIARAALDRADAIDRGEAEAYEGVIPPKPEAFE